MDDEEKIQLIIRAIIKKPPEPTYPTQNEHIDKSKDFHREPGDWFKEK